MMNMKRCIILIVIIIFTILLFFSCNTSEESYIFNDNEVTENNHCLVHLRKEVMYLGIYKLRV